MYKHIFSLAQKKMSIKLGPYHFSYTYIAYCLGCISYTFKDFLNEIPKDFTNLRRNTVRCIPDEIDTFEELELYFDNDECKYDQYLNVYDKLNFMKDMYDIYNEVLSNDDIMYSDSNIVITSKLMVCEFVRKLSEYYGFSYITDNMIVKATPKSKFRKYLTVKRQSIGYILQESLETHKDIHIEDSDGIYDSNGCYVNLFSEILTKKG